MKIFTRMKHMMLLVATVLCTGSAFAVDVKGSYAVVADDVKSGNAITSVDGITMTYGTDDTWTTSSASVTVDSKTFTVYASGSTNPTPSSGNIPTAGIYVVFEPEHDGTITAVVQNAGNTKSAYIVEDSNGNLVDGTVLIEGVETSWTSGTPLNSAAAYSGGVTFEVKGGSKYYFYIAGSKMRFMGFFYTYDDGYGIVWSQNFENENSYKEGWTIGGATTAYYGTRSNGSHFMNLKNTGSGNDDNTYTIESSLFGSGDWKFEFDFAGYNSNSKSVYLQVSNESGIKMLRIAFDASWSAPVSVTDVNDNKLGTFNCDLQDKNTRGKDIAVTVWHHVLIEGTSEGVYMTINAEDGTEEIARVKIADSGYPTAFNLHQGNALSQWAIDNMSLSLPGAKEGVSAPSVSMTKIDGINRTITIEPGVGSAGTASSATYYTTDNSEPNEGNGTLYEAPFEISATSTIKAISYLPDGTASEVAALEVEAGTEVSLGKDIINVTGLAGDGDFLSPVISYVYNQNSVLLSPEVSLTVTFNDEPIELPYTVTESGTISATVTAEGYASATEEYTLAAAYAKNLHEDFTAIAKEDVQEILGDSWTVTEGAGRWAFWYDRTYDIASTSVSGNIGIGNFVRTDNAKNLILGYGFGRNTSNGANSYWVNDAESDDIALYEVDESYGNNTNYAKHVVAYVDNNTLKYTTYGPVALAKASVYRPVQELLTVTEGEDFTAIGGYNSATYTRIIAEGTYGTICLPFAPDEASLENYTFFKMESVGADAINFVEETAPKANTPYIYCLKGENVAITGGATVVSADINDVTVNEDAWSMVGTFSKLSIDATTGNYYGLSSGKIVKATKTLTVKPYRAYFTSTTGANAVALRITRGDETTEITAADLDVQPATVIYDLAGRRVEKMEKGIYIVNGKKVIR